MVVVVLTLARRTDTDTTTITMHTGTSMRMRTAMAMVTLRTRITRTAALTQAVVPARVSRVVEANRARRVRRAGCEAASTRQRPQTLPLHPRLYPLLLHDGLPRPKRPCL